MKYKLLIFIFLIICSDCISQSSDGISANSLPKQIQNGGIRISYLEIKMPADEANLGLTGIHCNFELIKKLYAGIGMFSSVSGERGGLIALSINTGIKQQIFHSLHLDLSMVFGGGGGGNIPTYQGFILKPSAGIKFYLGEQLDLYGSFGKVYSPYGKLNSLAFSGGLVYAFSVLTGR